MQMKSDIHIERFPEDRNRHLSNTVSLQGKVSCGDKRNIFQQLPV